YMANSYCSVGVLRTSMGVLQRQLYEGGEYDIFKYAPMFESDFIQVSKEGELIDLDNRVRRVTVGVASTSPLFPLPDVMLLAQTTKVCDEHVRCAGITKGRGCKPLKTLELTRLLPLKFVKISIHNREKQQLCLNLATGRTFYLQLCPSSDAQKDLFSHWEKLVYILRPPVVSYSSTPMLQTGDAATTEDAKILTTELHRERDQDEAGIHKLRDVTGPTKRESGSGEAIAGAPHGSTAAVKSAEGSAAGMTTGLAGATIKDPGESGSGEAIAGATAGAPHGLNAAVESAEGSAAGMAIGLAGATIKDPGESGSGEDITGAASLSLQDTNLVLADVASTSSTVADGPESSMSMVLPVAVTTSKPAAGRAEGKVADPVVSTLQTEGYMSERDGSQKGFHPRDEAWREKK
ncbi:Golgi-associated RAB2 interactor protein 3-like, partial [Mesoplodon densirostris]|uniref:Golgi-associated RAB2 interactor protein 3-like n=1 Tax=Mesoplodon densirostris TaxID=48708 RepID=UPI0028DC8147